MYSTVFAYGCLQIYDSDRYLLLNTSISYIGQNDPYFTVKETGNNSYSHLLVICDSHPVLASYSPLCPMLGQQNWDDQAHLSFVQIHLCDLLELLVEPGQLSGSGQAIRDSQVCGTHISCHFIATNRL